MAKKQENIVKKFNQRRKIETLKPKESVNQTTRSRQLRQHAWIWDKIDPGRLQRALSLQCDILPVKPGPIAEFVSQATGEVYRTSLSTCGCTDYFQKHHQVGPCKHIIALALKLNVIDHSGNLCAEDRSVPSPKENTKKKKASLNRQNPKQVEKKIINRSTKLIEGCTFTACGQFKHITQKQAGEMIRFFGGQYMSSSSPNTDFMILGEKSPSSKVLSASQHGVAMISENDFLEMLHRSAARKGTNHFSLEEVIDLFKRLNIPSADKREKGGYYWIQSSFLSDLLLKKATASATPVYFAQTSKALKGKSGYFFK